MSNPPEVHALRTEAEEHAERIRSAAASIRRGWPHMLPTSAPAIQMRSGRSVSSGIVGSHGHAQDSTVGAYWADDWSPTVRMPNTKPTEDDIDGLTRIVSLRLHTLQVLHLTCRAIMDDFTITKAVPDGFDAVDMCRFIERWSGHKGKMDDAYDTAEELTDYARRVSVLVDPPKPERHTLGPCPFVVEGDIPDLLDRFCTGRVTTPIGGDQGEATCSECEQTRPVWWWEEAMGKARYETATIPDLVPLLSRRLHKDVTARTLRNWVRDGRIMAIAEPFGPQPQHRRFDVRVVLDAVARMGHECITCGTLWEGQGDVCTRCYVALSGAKPSRGKEVAPYAVGSVALAIVSPEVCSLDERERCEFSDLPVRWCACGRHARMDA